ncbi:MAG: hypothetical protein LQ340_001233 [Diploschistes diacapsis]|nr:MAG: hypothetical protein LQ340_001233 [Diploschistes diacapsis]
MGNTGPPVPSTTSPGPSSSSKAKESPAEGRAPKPPSSLPNRTQWSQKELRSFSFGLHKTIPNLTHYFESDFWNKQVPRLARREPAVRHALTALAAFHEKSNQHDAIVDAKGKSPETEIDPDAVDKFFLQQYNKAILELRPKMSGTGHQGVISTLVCCYIFMCIEGLHGRHLAMVNHITNGLNVYHEWIRRIDPNEKFDASSIEASVLGTFTRVDYHAATFIDNHVPEPHNLSIVGLAPPVDDFNPTFVSIEQARKHVDSLMGRTFMFLRFYDGSKFEEVPLDRIPQEIKDKHRVVGIWLHTCAVALDQLAHHVNYEESKMSTRSMALLKLRVKVLSVFHRRWPYERVPNEECELDFLSIYEFAKTLLMGHIKALLTPEDSDASVSSPDDTTEGPPDDLLNEYIPPPPSKFADPPIFTLETGIVPVLYYIAVTTLSPSLRRNAISLLRTANLREGLWSSARTANMAEARIAANNGQTCPMTGADMSELTKRLWAELKLEGMTEEWGIS